MIIEAQDIKAAELLGDVSDSAIAGTLATITRTPIDLGDLLYLLNNRGILTRLIRPADTGEKWSGTIVNMSNFVNDSSSPLAPFVNQWFSHITNDRNKVFRTTHPEFARLLATIKNAFADQPNMPTTADFEAIYGLGGGLKYPGITVEDVRSSRELHAREVERARLRVFATELAQRVSAVAALAADAEDATEQSIRDAVINEVNGG